MDRDDSLLLLLALALYASQLRPLTVPLNDLDCVVTTRLILKQSRQRFEGFLSSLRRRSCGLAFAAPSRSSWVAGLTMHADLRRFKTKRGVHQTSVFGSTRAGQGQL